MWREARRGRWWSRLESAHEALRSRAADQALVRPHPHAMTGARFSRHIAGRTKRCRAGCGTDDEDGEACNAFRVWQHSDAASQSAAFIKVVTGANARRSIPLVRHTIGRPGVQVSMIVRREGSFTLKPLEGEQSPLVNGQPVSLAGVNTQHDVIELARTWLQFAAADSGAKTAGSP